MRNYANTAVETQLVHALDASATSLEVVQGAGYPDGNFAIVIDAEVILVGTRTGNVFSGLQRGYDGTVAASHTAGSWVSHTAIADDYRQIWNVPEHDHDFSELLNIPATASRWPIWDEVTGKPTEFPPENHDAGKVTSGTFDLARIPTISVAKGGTGATDTTTARANLGIGSMAERNVFVQSTEPVGMDEGDIWIEVP